MEDNRKAGNKKEEQGVEDNKDDRDMEDSNVYRDTETGSQDCPKKSYRLVFLILVCMFAAIPLSVRLNSCGMLSDSGTLRFIFGVYAALLMFLAWYIYKKDRIYWITSYSYQDACNMSREERNKIGFKMWKGFGLCYGGYLLYLLFGSILGTPMGLDAGVFIGTVIISCILC